MLGCGSAVLFLLRALPERKRQSNAQIPFVGFRSSFGLGVGATGVVAITTCAASTTLVGPVDLVSADVRATCANVGLRTGL